MKERQEHYVWAADLTIRFMRTSAGLTQEELAEKLGSTTSNYISQLENGWRSPRLGLILAVAQACGFEIIVRRAE